MRRLATRRRRACCCSAPERNCKSRKISGALGIFLLARLCSKPAGIRIYPNCYTSHHGSFSMTRDRNEHKWLLIAAIAITVALVLLLVPQTHSGHASVWLAVLPVLFIGLV